METQHNDSVQIAQVLEQYYFKGIYEGHVEILSQAFHPGTLLYGDVQGQPYAKTLAQYLDAVKNRQSPKDSGKPFTSELLHVKVINSIAVAEVRMKMYTFNYYDLLSFHKIDGKWVIVNKMFSDVKQ
ncbi:nuclear transport factor 2 family protein [Paraflavitalea speifideaquila]|uniref:nuclear transport factor 2 family protein n=1 Tax=Paraflavitalea speifideaquila TaxID=3076558 RepID=UPI0028E5275F|nr:nuclear transport factor 2 family protein [Paraflavitalea speifideiaquila]